MADLRAFWTLSSFQLTGVARDEMSAAGRAALVELAAAEGLSDSSVTIDGAGLFEVGTVLEAIDRDAAEVGARRVVPAVGARRRRRVGGGGRGSRLLPDLAARAARLGTPSGVSWFGIVELGAPVGR